MRIVTKRRVNKIADEIIDAVLDNADFEVDTNGYQDYDVLMFIDKKNKPVVAKLFYAILSNKKPRKHWKLVNIAVRKTK